MRAEKRDFQKELTNAFFDLFFVTKQGLFSRRKINLSSENQFGRPKKKVNKIFKIFNFFCRCVELEFADWTCSITKFQSNTLGMF